MQMSRKLSRVRLGIVAMTMVLFPPCVQLSIRLNTEKALEPMRTLRTAEKAYRAKSDQLDMGDLTGTQASSLANAATETVALQSGRALRA